MSIVHDRNCLAASIIAAVENFRDAEITYGQFVTGMESVAVTGEGYLADGTMTCTCDRPFLVLDETVLSSGARRYVLQSRQSGQTIEAFVNGLSRSQNDTHVITISDDPLVHVRGQFLNDTAALTTWFSKLQLTDWETDAWGNPVGTAGQN